jgi:hypothetical protein
MANNKKQTVTVVRSAISGRFVTAAHGTLRAYVGETPHPE